MRIDENTLNIFNNSLLRCQSNPQFLSHFYQKFIISNSEVREMFSGTDMKQQKMMLHASIQMIMLASQGNEAAADYLAKISKKHSKSDLNIKPELYDIWLETLIETIRIIDPENNDQIENAWKEIMTFGIEYMKSRFETDNIN